MYSPQYTPTQSIARQHKIEFKQKLVRVIPIAVTEIKEAVVKPPLCDMDAAFGPTVIRRYAFPRIIDIQRNVARHYHITQAELISERRQREIVRPRQVAIWLSREYTPRSLPEIGRLFGYRDHTTIMAACRRIELLRVSDQQIEGDLRILADEIGVVLRPASITQEATHDPAPQPI